MGFVPNHLISPELYKNFQTKTQFTIYKWFLERVFSIFTIVAGSKVVSKYSRVSAVTNHKLGIQFLISMR